MIYINTTGNNGMSTEGSGDVLSGITASILAQTRGVWTNTKPIRPPACAVNLHGRAGDIVRDEKGNEKTKSAGRRYHFCPKQGCESIGTVLFDSVRCEIC